MWKRRRWRQQGSSFDPAITIMPSGRWRESSPSMPVFLIKNETFGNVTSHARTRGWARCLRYGAYGDATGRLKWMEQALPALVRAGSDRPIDLRSVIAQALHMGDEAHNRNRAATSLVIRQLMTAIVQTSRTETAIAVLKFMDGNDHFFLNLSMPAMKSMLEVVEGTEGCTLVTVMARNGTDFGIRVASMPERWFTAPAPLVDGLWLPGFSEKDANPDIGDSSITETGGLGGFAMAAAPNDLRFVGGTSALALSVTGHVPDHRGRARVFTVPVLDFRGTPLGIDVRKVMATGICPSSIRASHKEPGVGMVGAASPALPSSVSSRRSRR